MIIVFYELRVFSSHISFMLLNCATPSVEMYVT